METTMAWTETTRKIYARKASRYASDLTDREWELIGPHMPLPRRLERRAAFMNPAVPLASIS